MTLRRALKRSVEHVLATPVAGRLARGRVRGKVLVLAYHGVRPDDEAPAGERDLYVTRSAFGDQLDLLASVVDVVPLAEIDVPRGDRSRVAITFDDAYQGAVTAGVDELVKRSLPATIFVAPGRLERHVFWWDALAGGASLDEGARTHALETLGGADEEVRGWAAAAGLASADALPAYARSATLQELRVAAARPGITLGSHSWSHPNLARTPSASLAEELERPLAWLRTNFPDRTIPWIAYPYGADAEAVHEHAARAGYVGGLRIRGGWHAAGAHPPFARPRLNIPAGLSLAGLRARLVGAIRA